MFSYHPFLPEQREQVINVINRVAAEGKYLQTGRYVPTVDWEKALDGCADKQCGRKILIVLAHGSVGGFCRLFSTEEDRKIGNIGVVLLPEYRNKRAGTKLLYRMIGIASDYGYVRLTADILADNFISLRLFQRQGFVEQSRRIIFLPHRNKFVEEVNVQFFLTKEYEGYQCQTTQPLKDRSTVSLKKG